MKKTIICIDSFKLEYLRYAPFLASLAERCMHGRLRFPLGFEGGMETFFKGKSSTLALFCHSDNSSLKWTKRFSWLGTLLNLPINFIRLVKRQELFLIHNIPYNKLWMFEFAISSFNIPKNIRYAYIGELDKVAHKYGTKSVETIACIRRIDRKVRRIRFDLVMSDHGMLDVKEKISVPESRICFIDSTMARYWGSEDELKEIRKRLPKSKGRIINWPDKKYGQLIWLANPGILILPNYWQGSKACKAMHGYISSCKDMDGFYILRKKGNKKNLNVKQLRKQIGFKSGY